MGDDLYPEEQRKMDKAALGLLWLEVEPGAPNYDTALSFLLTAIVQSDNSLDRTYALEPEARKLLDNDGELKRLLEEGVKKKRFKSIREYRELQFQYVVGAASTRSSCSTVS